MNSGRYLVVVAGADAGAVDAMAAALRDDGAVRTAYSLEALLETVDDEVDVVLVDRGLGGGPLDDVLDEIRARDAGCQVALLDTDADRDRWPCDSNSPIDAVVSWDEDAVRETVSQLGARARYRRRLDEFYALAEERAALGDEADEATPERDRLDGQIERLRRDLEDEFRRIDDTSAFDAALSPRERDLTDRDRDGSDEPNGGASDESDGDDSNGEGPTEGESGDGSSDGAGSDVRDE